MSNEIDNKLIMTEKDNFHKLLSGCKTFEETLDLIINAKKYGINPDKYYYMGLLAKALTKEQEDKVLKITSKLGISLKNNHNAMSKYSTLLANSTSFQDSVKIIMEMQKKGVSIDKFCRVVFLKKATTNREREYANSILNSAVINSKNFNKNDTNLEEKIILQEELKKDNQKNVEENVPSKAVFKDNREIKTNDIKIISNIQEKPVFPKEKTTKYNENTIMNNKNVNGVVHPNKKSISVNITERNQTIIKYLKNIYNDTCQICGEKIEIDEGTFYSEVHHIQPLGEHLGPDVIENMIVLCPNHHSMFDRGAITLDLKKKLVIHKNSYNAINNKSVTIKHNIEDEYIKYHNRNIFNRQITSNSKIKNNNVFYNIPNRIKDKIFYGDIVLLEDIETREKTDIKIEDYYNKEFMLEIQKLILYKSINDHIEYKEFKYVIKDYHA